MKKVSFKKGTFYLLFCLIIITVCFLIIKDKYLHPGFLKKEGVGIENLVRYFPFSKENALKEWEEKVLKGKVDYGLEKENTAFSYVRAKSHKTASALYYKLKLDIKKQPVISWKWRVDEFPEKKLPERIEDTKEEDFAARVYVIFPAAFFTNSKVIEYIWSESLPVGTFGKSGYSKNIKILVLETGASEDWHFEKRDIYEDYVKLFSKAPRLNIGAIAFMTDADSTKTTADAVYDEIEIGYK